MRLFVACDALIFFSTPQRVALTLDVPNPVSSSRLHSRQRHNKRATLEAIAVTPARVTSNPIYAARKNLILEYFPLSFLDLRVRHVALFHFLSTRTARLSALIALPPLLFRVCPHHSPHARVISRRSAFGQPIGLSNKD
jgi:hypothetical protein